MKPSWKPMMVVAFGLGAVAAPAAQAAAITPNAPSACQLRLTTDIALIHPLASIKGPGSCGAEDVVRFDAVVLKDGRRIALTPAATLRCPMAEAVARWIPGSQICDKIPRSC